MSRMVKVGMRQKYSVNLNKLSVERCILELLPEPRCFHIVSINSLQWRKQGHHQRIKQSCTATRLQIFLVEALVALIWEAEIKEKLVVSFFKEYLISTNFIDTAVEGQAYHVSS